MAVIDSFAEYAARLGEFIRRQARLGWPARDTAVSEDEFRNLAATLFRLQYERVVPFRQFCERRRISPSTVPDWHAIPAVPTRAFKELDFTSLPPDQRKTVFLSSGTTEHRPSRHYHDTDSLRLYEASLLPWFRAHVLTDQGGPGWELGEDPSARMRFAILTPPPVLVPHSSLVHMFEAARQRHGASGSRYTARLGPQNTWIQDMETLLPVLWSARQSGEPLVLLGTAFSFVQLLDHLRERDLQIVLPARSRVLETGGYKGRTRAVAKRELHAMLAASLGVAKTHVISEYGMCELSSQAYDSCIPATGPAPQDHPAAEGGRVFRFPPWARAQVISPETKLEVADGETGLLRVYDLANMGSVMAIQTEDQAIRRGAGFELLGRRERSEPRGCSWLEAR